MRAMWEWMHERCVLGLGSIAIVLGQKDGTCHHHAVGVAGVASLCSDMFANRAATASSWLSWPAMYPLLAASA